MPTIKVAVDARGAKTGAREFNKSTKSMTKSTGALGKALLGLASALASAFAFREIINTFTAFEDSMAMLKGVSGATADEFARLSDSARQLGASTKFTAAEASNAMTALARMGFNTNDILSSTSAVLDLATGQMMGLEQAADITATTIRQFGLETDDATRIADVLTHTANSSGTSVQLMGESMKFAASGASALGVSVEETSAAIGVLGDAGIRGSMAGTGLNRVFASLLDRSGKLDRSLQKLGIAYDDVNPEKNNLIEIFEEFSKGGLDAATAFDIFGQRGFKAALALSKSKDRLAELTEENERAAGAARRMAAILEQTLGFQLKALRSAAEEAMLQIGESGLAGGLGYFVSVATGAVQILTGFEEKVTENNREAQILAGVIQVAIDIFWGFVEVLRGVWNIISPLVNRLADAVAVLLDLESAVGGSKTEARELASILKTIATVLGVIVGIAAVQYFLDLSVAMGKAFVAGVQGAASFVASMGPAIAIVGVLTAALAGLAIGSYLNKEFKIVQEVASATIFGIMKLIEEVKAGFSIMGAVAKQIWYAIRDRVAGVVADIVINFGEGLNTIEKLWNSLGGIFNTVSANILEIWAGFQKALENAWINVTNAMKDPWGTFVTLIKRGLGTVLKFVGNQVNDMMRGIRKALNEAIYLAQAAGAIGDDTANNLYKQVAKISNVGDAVVAMGNDLKKSEFSFEVVPLVEEDNELLKIAENIRKQYKEAEGTIGDSAITFGEAINEQIGTGESLHNAMSAIMEERDKNMRILNEAMGDRFAEIDEEFGGKDRKGIGFFDSVNEDIDKAVAGMQPMLDKLREAAGLSDEHKEALAKQREALKKLADEQKNAKESQDELTQADQKALITLNEMIDKTQQELDLLQTGAAGKEEAARLLELERIEREAGSDAVRGRIEEYKALQGELERTKIIQESLANVAQGVGDAFAQSFTDVLTGTKTAKEAFKDFAQSVIQLIVKIMVQQMIARAVTGGLNAGFGAMMADGGAFSGGVQAFANGAVVEGPTAFAMAGNKMGIMGEAGPEAIMPLQRDARGRLGVAAEGSGQQRIEQKTTNVTFNIRTPDANSFRRSERQRIDDVRSAARRM